MISTRAPRSTMRARRSTIRGANSVSNRSACSRFNAFLRDSGVHEPGALVRFSDGRQVFERFLDLPVLHARLDADMSVRIRQRDDFRAEEGAASEREERAHFLAAFECVHDLLHVDD